MKFFRTLLILNFFSLHAMEQPNEWVNSTKINRPKPTLLTAFDRMRYHPHIISAFKQTEFIYFNSSSSPEEIEKACSTLKDLANQGMPFPPALYFLGVIYLNGWAHIQPDYNLGEHYLWRASRLHYPSALLALSSSYAQRARYLMHQEENSMKYAALVPLINRYSQKNNIFSSDVDANQYEIPLVSHYKLKEIYGLIAARQLEEASKLFKTIVDDLTPDMLCELIVSDAFFEIRGHNGNYLLGMFWQKLSDMSEEDRLYVLAAGNITLHENSRHFCINNAFRHFEKSAGYGHPSSWIELGNYINSHEYFRKITKKLPAACYYKAYLHGDTDEKDSAKNQLISLAHIYDAENVDMQAIIRLILIGQKDEAFFLHHFKPLLSKVFGITQHEKKELVQLLHSPLSHSLLGELKKCLESDSKLGYLFGNILADADNLKESLPYLEKYAQENVVGAWHFAYRLIKLHDMKGACVFLKSNAECIKNQANFFGEPVEEYKRFVLSKLDKCSEKDGCCAFTLGYLYADGTIVEEDEDKALFYFNRSAELKYPKGLYTRVLYEQEYERSEHLFFDLLYLLGTQFHDETLLKKLLHLLDQKDFSLKEYYIIALHALDHENELALRACKKAEAYLCAHKDEITLEQGMLIYSSGVYDRFLEHIESGDMHITQMLAEIHSARAQHKYGLQSTVLHEWQLSLKLLGFIGKEYSLPEHLETNKIKSKMFKLLEESSEKRDLAIEIKDVYKAANLWYTEHCLMQNNDPRIEKNIFEEKAVVQLCASIPKQKSDLSKSSSIFNQAVILFNEKKYDEALDLFCEVGIEEIDFVKARAYQGFIHCEQNHDVLSCFSFGSYIEKNALLEKALQDRELTQKVYTYLDMLKERNPIFGYYIAKFRLFEATANKNYKSLSKLVSQVCKIDDGCLNEKMYAEFFRVDLYDVFKKVAETAENQVIRYFINKFLFVVHARRALWCLQNGKEWVAHQERAEMHFNVIEQLKQTDTQIDDLVDGLKSLVCTFIETDDIKKADQYLHKILFFDRKNEFALCKRVNLFLNCSDVVLDNRTNFDQALNGLKCFEKTKNPLALKLLAQAYGVSIDDFGESYLHKYIKPNIQKAVAIVKRLASLDLDDCSVMSARKTLALWYLRGENRVGLNIKRDPQRGISIISDKADTCVKYRFELLMFLFACAQVEEVSCYKDQLYRLAWKLCDVENLNAEPSIIMDIELFRAMMILKGYVGKPKVEDAINIIEKYARKEQLPKSFSMMKNLSIISDLESIVNKSKIAFMFKTLGMLLINAANLELVDDKISTFKDGERYLNLCYMKLAEKDYLGKAVILLFLAQIKTDPSFINFSAEKQACNALSIAINHLGRFFKMDQERLVIYRRNVAAVIERIRTCAQIYLSGHYKTRILQRIEDELPKIALEES